MGLCLQPLIFEILLHLSPTSDSLHKEAKVCCCSCPQVLHARRFQASLYLSWLRVPLRISPSIPLLSLIYILISPIFVKLSFGPICRYIYNDRTPFEKLPDNYFCPGNLLLSSSTFFPNLIRIILVSTSSNQFLELPRQSGQLLYFWRWVVHF